MKPVTLLLFIPFLFQCSQSITKSNVEKENPQYTQANQIVTNSILKDTISDFGNLSEEAWKQILTQEEFAVLRNKGTEKPFSGKFNSNKKEGVYLCKGCQTELFSSDTKFDSGTGWPSFYDKVNSGVEERADNSYGMVRTEVVCSTCNGHLGHVFNDGPKPTGMRYCINSLSLDFKEQ